MLYRYCSAVLYPTKYHPETLELAIKNTFERRGTHSPREHILFQQSFSLDDQRISQWNGFLKKSKLEKVAFSDVQALIIEILKPLYDKLG